MLFLKKIIPCWQIQLLKRGTFELVKNQHERHNKMSTQGKIRYLCLAVWYTLVQRSHGTLFLLLPAPELLNSRILLPPLSTFFSFSPIFWHKLLRYHFWWKFTHVKKQFLFKKYSNRVLYISLFARLISAVPQLPEFRPLPEFHPLTAKSDVGTSLSLSCNQCKPNMQIMCQYVTVSV